MSSTLRRHLADTSPTLPRPQGPNPAFARAASLGVLLQPHDGRKVPPPPGARLACAQLGEAVDELSAAAAAAAAAAASASPPVASSGGAAPAAVAAVAFGGSLCTDGGASAASLSRQAIACPSHALRPSHGCTSEYLG